MKKLIIIFTILTFLSLNIKVINSEDKHIKLSGMKIKIQGNILVNQINKNQIKIRYTAKIGNNKPNNIQSYSQSVRKQKQRTRC